MRDKLDNFEWLARTQSVKSQSFSVGTGGVPDIDWRDKCGAFAKLPSPAHKALCEILVWGDYNDNKTAKQTVVDALASKMVQACNESKLKPREYDLRALAEKMAAMALTWFIYPLFDTRFKAAGKLWFCGIEMEVKTYQKNWLQFETQMTNILYEMRADIDDIIGDYRYELNKKNTASA